jgi:ABC-type tungstate transport system substrate-binding protein
MSDEVLCCVGCAPTSISKETSTGEFLQSIRVRLLELLRCLLKGFL